MSALFIIIPAYNEAENIENTIDEWYPVIKKYDADGASRLIIIDDGSKDDTLKLANKKAENNPYIKVISKENSGHGASIYFGYKYALENGADYIFQTDSDGQTLAEEFYSFWTDREKYDVLIGNRGRRKDGFGRKTISFVVRAVVFTVFKVRAEDVNTPYRLMKREALEKALNFVPENFNLTNIALTAVFLRLNIKVGFKNITFKPRQGGKNSINIPKIIKIGIKAFFDLCKIESGLFKYDKGKS